MTRRVLLVEDDPHVAQLVVLHLRDANYHVVHEMDGQAGLMRAQHEKFDLLVLDLMLPNRDGMSICKHLRSTGHCVPILMLTAKSTEADRVSGLEEGADDYLTKPFSILELQARIKAIFRRVDTLSGQKLAESEKLIVGDLEIDTAKRGVRVNDREINLTSREFDLLVHFAKNPGHVYSRSQLLDLVWGYGHDGYEHTVNSHINRLRAKLEPDPTKPSFIITVWGAGYKMSDRRS